MQLCFDGTVQNQDLKQFSCPDESQLVEMFFSGVDVTKVWGSHFLGKFMCYQHFPYELAVQSFPEPPIPEAS